MKSLWRFGLNCFFFVVTHSFLCFNLGVFVMVSHLLDMPELWVSKSACDIGEDCYKMACRSKRAWSCLCSSYVHFWDTFHCAREGKKMGDCQRLGQKVESRRSQSLLSGHLAVAVDIWLR